MKPLRFAFWLLPLLAGCLSDPGRTIKIKGSDTEVNLAVQLTERFHTVHPGIFLSVSGGGSGLGIASLMNGTADVANSSRALNAEELALFVRKGIQVDSFVFAQDAIAFVVGAGSPLDSISTTELSAVLSGRYADWSALTGHALPVNIYGRQSNSGTYDFVKRRLGIRFSPAAKQMNGNAQIIEAIKADGSGIGYVGAGYVRQRATPGVKVLAVYEAPGQAAISPFDSVAVAEGRYFFQRPLFQFYRAEAHDRVKVFLDFEKSAAGRELIRAAGYYPPAHD